VFELRALHMLGRQSMARLCPQSHMVVLIVGVGIPVTGGESPPDLPRKAGGYDSCFYFMDYCHLVAIFHTCMQR
jgi:hypothetical protein